MQPARPYVGTELRRGAAQHVVGDLDAVYGAAIAYAVQQKLQSDRAAESDVCEDTAALNRRCVDGRAPHDPGRRAEPCWLLIV